MMMWILMASRVKHRVKLLSEMRARNSRYAGALSCTRMIWCCYAAWAGGLVQDEWCSHVIRKQ